MFELSVQPTQKKPNIAGMNYLYNIDTNLASALLTFDCPNSDLRLTCYTLKKATCTLSSRLSTVLINKLV